MNVSILLPARGRPYNLIRSVRSVFDLAANRAGVEVLCRFDSDDEQLGGLIAALSAAAPTATIVGETDTVTNSWGGSLDGTIRYWIGERLGYWGMHEYFNQLAFKSAGNVLINWNDDAEFLTPSWDSMLMVPDARRIVQQLKREVASEADCTFPAIGRDLYEAMGHISLNAHCDAWISDVASAAGVQVSRNDIQFTHWCLDDRTHRDKLALPSAGRDMTAFKQPEQVALRAKDVTAIRNVLCTNTASALQ